MPVMADVSKRPRAEDAGAIVEVKRSKQAGAIVAAGPLRTSSLQAPIMLMTGHGGEVFSAKFSPDGQTVASASFDRHIFLWNTKSGSSCDNHADMEGHAGAIVELKWSPDGTQLFTASTDKSCAVWDAERCERIRRLRGHTAFVNSCCPAKTGAGVVTGSDDGTIKIWDSRKRNFVHSLANKYQVTATCYGATEHQVITGGLDNVIKVWDLRNQSIAFSLEGHTDTVTGLSLSPDGTHVLSNSMDNSVVMWDVKNYAGDRKVATFKGAQHGFEKNLIKCAWTPDGKHVGCGSADRNVYVWNVASRALKYRLPGHTGSVNDVDFHPSEPVVLSASSDKRLYLGELTL